MSKRAAEENGEASMDSKVKKKRSELDADGVHLSEVVCCSTGNLKTCQDEGLCQPALETAPYTQETCTVADTKQPPPASAWHSAAGDWPKSPASDPTAVNPADDHEYFHSYSYLDIHRTMIDDGARTQAYRRAILANYPLFYGKVVLDVGCGTGILSMFCCQAGAKRVYAVEASGAAEFARRVAAENGYSERVRVLQCRMEDAQLPEKVDVIVSEWMGHALLYESMLDSVLLARDRWLRPGGALFPERAVLKMALCSALTVTPAHADDGDAGEFWRSVHDRYGVHMASLAEVARQKRSTSISARVTALLPEEVHSHAATVFDLDLRTVPVRDVRELTTDAPLDLVSFGRAELTGLVLWFDVLFPSGEALSTSPYAAETHWGQTVLPLPAQTVDQDTIFRCELYMSQNKRHPRNWNFDVELAVGDEESGSIHWVMDGTG